MKKSRPFSPLATLAIVIYFFSGTCSLTYEIIWQRLLKLILGNTTYATSITIAVFMGGLALGAYLVRDKADRIKNRLLVYGWIEMAIALCALLTPLLLRGMDAAFVLFFRSFALQPPVLLILHIIISTVILAVPTVLMGTTLPILAGMIVRSPRFTGWETSILYSLNTLGALAGAGITGFYTIRIIGVYPAYFIAVGLNFLIGTVCILIASRYRSIVTSVSNTTQQLLLESNRVRTRGLQTALLIWLFIMGFVAMGYEILWIRTVVHLLKAEIYTFSAVLCVYLFGYSAGIFVGGRLVKHSLQPIVLFFLIAPLLGLCGILYLPMLTHIMDLPLLWNYNVLKFLLGIFGYLPHLYLSVLFFFLPSFLMGVCFPVLVQVEQNLGGKTGGAVSTAYGINTLGCVLGAVTTGFLLIPLLGTQKSLLLLGSAAVLCGVSAGLFVKSGKPAVLLIGSIIPLLCLIIVLMQPKDIVPRWINNCEGKGTYKVKLLDCIEGITTTASVHRYSDGSTVISTAGINVAGDALPLRQTQKFQGHFPIIMHGSVRSICTVGFGTGELTRTLTYHNIPDITCVEISPEMVQLSKRYFSAINLGNDLEKRVHMVYMDAKNFMHLTKKTFDVIENDCVWPGTFAESSSLYTQEYFTDAKNRLNDNGLFSTWLTLDLPKTTLLSIIRTFNSVFENMLFVYPNYAPDRHILLVGQKNAHPYGYLTAEKEFDKTKVRESLSLIGIHALSDLLGSILTDATSLGTFSGNATVNSDYVPFVEFDMNRTHLIDDRFITWENLEVMLRNTKRVDYNRLLSFTGLDSTKIVDIRTRLIRNEEANEYLLESFCMHTPEERLSLVTKGLTIAPENQGLLRMRQMLTGNR